MLSFICYASPLWRFRQTTSFLNTKLLRQIGIFLKLQQFARDICVLKPKGIRLAGTVGQIYDVSIPYNHPVYHRIAALESILRLYHDATTLQQRGFLTFYPCQHRNAYARLDGLFQQRQHHL